MSKIQPQINPKVESDQAVHQAIVRGDTISVSVYLEEGGSPNIIDAYDCEPIYTAVKYDEYEIATMLLNAGGNVLRRSKFRGDPLGVACYNWNLRMIDFCIEAGADINAVYQKETILDTIIKQREHISKVDLHKWKKTYDKLVQLGATRYDEDSK